MLLFDTFSLGDVQTGRDHETHCASAIFDRHESEIDNPLTPVCYEIDRFAMKRTSLKRLCEPCLEPGLDFPAVVPPTSFPKRFADNLFPSEAAALRDERFTSIRVPSVVITPAKRPWSNI